MRQLARSTSAAAVLAGVACALLALPSASAARPADLSWSALDTWYRAVGPEVVVAEAVRASALVLTAWLLLVVLLQAVASVPALRSIRPLADLLTPGRLQPLLRGMVGVSMVAGVAIPSGDDPLIAPAPDVAVMVPLEPEPSEAAPTDTLVDVAVMTPLDGSPPTTTSSTTTTSQPASPTTSTPTSQPTTPGVEPAPAAPPGTAVAVPLPTAAPGAVVVQDGDSFWTIAEAQLVRLGRPTDDRGLTRHWRDVVAANRHRLVDPTNPDLLYPGQVLELPEPR